VADVHSVEARRFQEFLNSAEKEGARLFAKRLAANDTLATGSNQAGSYFPNSVAFSLFPSLRTASGGNPRVAFDVEVVSHEQASQVVNVIWYNQKTRNECHVTGWGGRNSPVLDSEATGSICIFAFFGTDGGDVDHCRVWLCSSLEDEEEIENRFDFVEPGVPLFLDFTSGPLIRREPTTLYAVAEEQLELWTTLQESAGFPTGKELVDFVVQAFPEFADLPVDGRLLRRREAEYSEFQRIEKTVVLPQVREGFSDVDRFVDYANSVTNRRKSRAGKSLELHMEVILHEKEITGFAHDKVTEGNKRPDFIFPSLEAYMDLGFEARNLRMLACKTTCKDRWRQIIDEASRISQKHLLTLQRGVSENQHKQMKEAGVKLVAPKELHRSFPKSVRPDIESIEGFISELKGLSN